MREQYVYVVVRVDNGMVVMVYRDKNKIDDEYFGNEYSIQHTYYWK